MVRVHIIFSDLSYVEMEEKDSYPLEEMINELAGVVSLYFGFSVASLAMFVCKSLRRIMYGRKMAKVEFNSSNVHVI